jgi:hypothetical protein
VLSNGLELLGNPYGLAPLQQLGTATPAWNCFN